MSNLTKKQSTILIVIGIIMLLIIAYYVYTITSKEDYEELEVESEQNTIEIEENVDNSSEEIIIHIAGQVKNAGIVKIKEGARIADVIEQAGGLTEEADITDINLAYIVEDGQKITIPKKGDFENTEIITESAQQTEDKTKETSEKLSNSNEIISQKVNINKANLQELQTLPGIGEATAQKIIDYRNKNGNFDQIEDIKNVSGIGEAKFENIKDNIKVK